MEEIKGPDNKDMALITTVDGGYVRAPRSVFVAAPEMLEELHSINGWLRTLPDLKKVPGGSVVLARVVDLIGKAEG